MVFFNQKKINGTKTFETIIECECGTHLVQIVSYEDEQEAFINFYTDDFYGKQENKFFRRLYKKLKYIWYIIRGREYLLEEVVVSKNDINKIVDALQKMKIQEVKK